MSAYWGYACVSHEPPLVSDRWFNRGEEVLVDAFLRERAGEWPSDPENDAWDEPLPVVLRGCATTGPIEWLRSHPHCDVVLRNEYGDVRPIGQGVIEGERSKNFLRELEAG